MYIGKSLHMGAHSQGGKCPHLSDRLTGLSKSPSQFPRSWQAVVGLLGHHGRCMRPDGVCDGDHKCIKDGSPWEKHRKDQGARDLSICWGSEEEGEIRGVAVN